MPPQRLVLLALPLVFLTTACASVQSRPANPDSAPATPVSHSTAAPAPEAAAPEASPTPAAPAPATSAPANVQRVIDVMQDLYNTGLEAHKAGRYAEARDYFDQAVEAALDSNVVIDEAPALKLAYEEMLENIDGLENDLYQDGADKGEEAPKDELRDITQYLTPEEAEKEREKVQPAAEAMEYDLPVELNDKVLTFIEAFTTRMRGPFEGGLRRSGMYLPMIKRILAEEGLPTDLAYMVHQESAFKTNAYSRAKAKGLWQFIAPTGRKYGLKRDAWVDERSDPEKSTRAAAAYLRDLYAMFGDWYLAMAAYNAGEGKVGRSMARTGAKDFWALSAHRRALRTETRNYVPAILASIVIDKAPAEYGFHLETEPELTYEQVPLDTATDLRVVADCAGTTVEEIRKLNPELRTMATPPYAGGYTVKVPSGSSAAFLEKYAAVPVQERLKWTAHEVRRGETIGAIARRYGVSTQAILSSNGLRSAKRLKVGQTLIIPMSGAPLAKVSPAQLDEDAPTYEKGEKVIHRVRRGDTLGRIASRYQTSVASLRKWNGIEGSHIRPGQRLTVFYAGRNAAEAVERSDEGPMVATNGEYLVRRGDTLYSIAQRFGMTLEQLRSVNNLGRSSMIRPGDRLRIVDRVIPESASGTGVPTSSTKATPSAATDSGAAGGR